MARLLRDIERWPGWSVEKTSEGWRAVPPDKTKPKIKIHGTPSDHRSWKNLLADLRRAGAPI